MKKESKFKECLLIPTSFLSKKKKSKLKDGKNISSKILSNKNIPASVRLRIFDNFMRFHHDKPMQKEIEKEKPVQEDFLHKLLDKIHNTNPVKKEENEKDAEEEEEEEKKYGIDNITRDIPDENKPKAIAILHRMMQSGEITWNEKFEVIIEGTKILKSDIREIMK